MKNKFQVFDSGGELVIEVLLLYRLVNAFDQSIQVLPHHGCSVGARFQSRIREFRRGWNAGMPLISFGYFLKVPPCRVTNSVDVCGDCELGALGEGRGFHSQSKSS